MLDLNQVLIANLMQHLNGKSSSDLDENFVRHMALNSLRGYIKQFKSKYGKMVICCDSKKYWRRDVFPHYKSHRKKDRDKSDFDWGLIFDTLNKIRDELKLHFPHKVLEIEGAEADDIIAVLCSKFARKEDILIISSDKDFVQLQKYNRVQQYSPILKRFIQTDDPTSFVKEHIMRGDRGDGIPNFLSPGDTFVSGERQKSINKRNLMEWMKMDPPDFCKTDDMKNGYARNQLLVDFESIPVSLRENILVAYDNAKPGTMKDMLNYMIEKKMRQMIEVADEFRG